MEEILSHFESNRLSSGLDALLEFDKVRPDLPIEFSDSIHGIKNEHRRLKRLSIRGLLTSEKEEKEENELLNRGCVLVRELQDYLNESGTPSPSQNTGLNITNNFNSGRDIVTGDVHNDHSKGSVHVKGDVHGGISGISNNDATSDAENLNPTTD